MSYEQPPDGGNPFGGDNYGGEGNYDYGQQQQDQGGGYNYAQTTDSGLTYGSYQQPQQPSAVGGNENGNPFAQYEEAPFQQDVGNFYDDVEHGQYKVYGGAEGSDEYSLGTENSQYEVAESHASTEQLAETMNLPENSGEPGVVDLSNYDFGASSGAAATGQKKKKKKKKKSWYQSGYYKTYFNFDSDEILRRLLKAINPVIYSKFWEETKERPDLYVPVWGTTTLWFLLVCCGTLGAYTGSDECDNSIQYQKVGWGALTLYGYLFFLPLTWYCLSICWISSKLDLFDHICIYGYSLLPYIPTMFIALEPIVPVRWVPFLLSYGLSSYFLVANYLPCLSDNSTHAMILIGTMVLIGLALPLVFQLYFFSDC